MRTDHMSKSGDSLQESSRKPVSLSPTELETLRSLSNAYKSSLVLTVMPRPIGESASAKEIRTANLQIMQKWDANLSAMLNDPKATLKEVKENMELDFKFLYIALSINNSPEQSVLKTTSNQALDTYKSGRSDFDTDHLPALISAIPGHLEAVVVDIWDKADTANEEVNSAAKAVKSKQVNVNTSQILSSLDSTNPTKPVSAQPGLTLNKEQKQILELAGKQFGGYGIVFDLFDTNSTNQTLEITWQDRAKIPKELAVILPPDKNSRSEEQSYMSIQNGTAMKYFFIELDRVTKLSQITTPALQSKEQPGIKEERQNTPQSSYRK